MMLSSETSKEFGATHGEDRITVNLKTTRESTFTQTFTAGGVHSFLENCSIGGRSNVSHFIIMFEKKLNEF